MQFERWGLGIGRFLISVIFILSGTGKLFHFAASASMMAGKGIPLAKLALTISIIVEVAGGLMLLTGFRARYAALVMAVWLVPVTLVFHNFWGFQGPQQQEQMINFLKNLAIIGGLIVLAVANRTRALARGTAEGE